MDSAQLSPRFESGIYLRDQKTGRVIFAPVTTESPLWSGPVQQLNAAGVNWMRSHQKDCQVATTTYTDHEMIAETLDEAEAILGKDPPVDPAVLKAVPQGTIAGALVGGGGPSVVGCTVSPPGGFNDADACKKTDEQLKRDKFKAMGFGEAYGSGKPPHQDKAAAADDMTQFIRDGVNKDRFMAAHRVPPAPIPNDELPGYDVFFDMSGEMAALEAKLGKIEERIEAAAPAKAVALKMVRERAKAGPAWGVLAKQRAASSEAFMSVIRQVVARGWCDGENKGKVMDPVLAEAISLRLFDWLTRGDWDGVAADVAYSLGQTVLKECVALPIEKAAKLIEERSLGALSAWLRTAREYSNAAEFYRGLVEQVGETLGDECYIADDGTRSKDVLALKVPEVAKKLKAKLDALDGFQKQPATILGRSADKSTTLAALRMEGHDKPEDQTMAAFGQTTIGALFKIWKAGQDFKNQANGLT